MVLAGKYRLLGRIAEGGMGAVWRAEALHLGSPVAIKLIHQRDASNGEMLARFEAEAEIAAQLRSPHVVQVFDAGVDRESGMPFIAMELLDGVSLRERLAGEGTLEPVAVVDLLSQVARALTRAHELGIVHRDLKPANVFLLRDGDRDVVKVLDFGIAKRTRMRAGPTVTGDLLGTPTYMSPEQILSSKEVDYRTDLWSLAIIAAECLTGKLPFDCDNLPGLALLICHGQSTPPSQLGPVPAGFDAWFQRATRVRPAERFASATVLVEELRRVCQGQPVVGPVIPVDREEDMPTRSDPAEVRPSPSVGPTTTTVSRQMGPLRRQQRQRRVAALSAVAILLLVGTCTMLNKDDSGPVAAAVPAGQQRGGELPPIAEPREPEPLVKPAEVGGTPPDAERAAGAEGKRTAGEMLQTTPKTSRENQATTGKRKPPTPPRKPAPKRAATAENGSDLGI